jgi:acetylornithine deacetylase
MGRVLTRLEQLGRELQSRKPHPLLGNGSLHASLIEGGRELSSYPDVCRLQLERRTVPGETADTFAREMRSLLDELCAHDREFEASVKLLFSRPPYELSSSHDLPGALESAAISAGARPATVGMSFWTDAAILGEAGIPSVLFGPGGAGLHSVQEYVTLNEVTICRDALASLALAWP